MKNLSSNVVGIICLPGWDRLTDLPKSGDTPGLTGLSRLVEGFLIKWRISTVILPIWMISFHLTSWWLIDLYIKIGFSVRLFQSLNHQEVNLKIAAFNQDNHPFNLHPEKVAEKWFEGYPVKSTQIFMGCHLIFFSYHLPGSLDLICIHKIFSRFLNKWKTH